MDPAMQSLQNGINDRQRELRALVPLLGKKAFELQRLSNWLRVATIMLSSLSSLKAVSEAQLGASAAVVIMTFAVINLGTTVLLGLEAAFKFEKRAADLNVLAALSQATVIAVDSEWRKKIGSLYDTDLRNAARDILTLQDAKLSEIHQRAASLGMNLVLEVRELEDPADRPYAA
jgi:non-ribosomal peptide synthetase component E (peptide arylation enzyme)